MHDLADRVLTLYGESEKRQYMTVSSCSNSGKFLDIVLKLTNQIIFGPMKYFMEVSR